MSAALPRPDARARRVLRRALAVLQPLWLIAAVGLVAAMAVVAARDVPLEDLRWWLLPAALAATVVWWIGLARVWSLVVAGAVRREDLRTWCRTQPLRYLPGGVWAPASRLALTRGAPTDRVATVAAENVVALCAAGAIGGLCLALDGRLAWAPLVLVAVIPVVAARLTGSASRLDTGRTTAATLNALVAFAAYAGAAVLAQAAVSGWQEPEVVAGAAALAWAAGLVAVFAPGGVGVRELAYVGLLAGTLPRADALAAAVTLRLLTIIAELAVLPALGRHTGPMHTFGDESSRTGRSV